MKVETFYQVVSEDNKISSVRYAKIEAAEARTQLTRMAQANPRVRFHLMKRVVSVVCGDLTWEDSE